MERKTTKPLRRFICLLFVFAFLLTSTIPAGAEIEGKEAPAYLAENNAEENNAEENNALGLGAADYEKLSAEIDAAMKRRETELVISGYPFAGSVSQETVNRLLDGFVELVESDFRNYYVRVSGISVTFGLNTVTPTISFEYRCTPAQCAEVEAAAEILLDGIAGSSLSDVEKALLVHDRLAVWCEYDSVSLANNNIPKDSYTVYGTMGKRISVCQGYAESYSYLMNTLGIPTRVVNSEGANHAWNIVTIDGKDYHVDVTWDDPTQDAVGRVRHDYFLISTNRLKELDSSRAAANDFDSSPVSTDYEDGIWTVSDAAFTLLDGEIYFINNHQNVKSLYAWNGGNPRQILEFADYPDDDV